jgi:hypothetical protein
MGLDTGASITFGVLFDPGNYDDAWLVSKWRRLLDYRKEVGEPEKQFDPKDKMKVKLLKFLELLADTCELDDGSSLKVVQCASYVEPSYVVGQELVSANGDDGASQPFEPRHVRVTADVRQKVAMLRDILGKKDTDAPSLWLTCMLWQG